MDDLHTAVCQAVALLNVSTEVARSKEGREARDILRQALVSYAQPPQRVERCEICGMRADNNFCGDPTADCPRACLGDDFAGQLCIEGCDRKAVYAYTKRCPRYPDPAPQRVNVAAQEQSPVLPAPGGAQRSGASSAAAAPSALEKLKKLVSEIVERPIDRGAIYLAIDAVLAAAPQREPAPQSELSEALNLLDLMINQLPCACLGPQPGEVKCPCALDWDALADRARALLAQAAGRAET